MLEVGLLFGPAERLGLDELFVDASAEVERRLEAQRHELDRIGPEHALCESAALLFTGHLHSARVSVAADCHHRVQDLRVTEALGNVNSANLPIAPESWHAAARLAEGSRVAAELRAVLKSRVGIRTSGGVACNKPLAKLVSGLHKPDDQTILLPDEVGAFLAPLATRVLLGIGECLVGV